MRTRGGSWGWGGRFVRARIFLPPVLLVVAAGCGSRQEWFPVPAQRPSLGEGVAGSLGHFVYMSQGDADAYIAGGMRAQSEGSWRWAHENPILRFYLPEVGRIRFRMEFSFPDDRFRETGPVTLTFAVNGRTFDRVRYDHPGGHQYDRAVPIDLLRQDAVNLVDVTPDKTAILPSGERLGFVLTSAGFAE